jgi:hypothetical protein
MNCTNCLGEQISSDCVNIVKNTSSLTSKTLTKLVEEIDLKFPKEELFNGKNLIKDTATQGEKNQFFVDEFVKIKSESKDNLLTEKIGIDLTSVNSNLTKGSYTIGEILIAFSEEIKNLKTRITELETNNVY